MNQDLQKAVVLALAIISVSVGYYFVYHLPRQEKQEIAERQKIEELENIQKCERIASEKSAKEVKDFADGGHGHAFNPQYKFVKETNQCLYLGGFVTDNTFTQYIVDLYTNKQIAGYIKLGEEYSEGNETEFKQKRQEIFGE